MRQCLLVLFLCAVASAEAPLPPSPAWLKETTRVAYTDLPNRNAQGDWPDKLIADCAASKVQLLFSRVHSGADWEGVAWNSKFLPADPKMKGEDRTRYIVDLCHKNHIRYAAYLWAQREHASVGEQHPDWRCINSAGKPTGYFCVNQPGYRELVRNLVVELVKDCGVDAIFFDMFHARDNECYCPACTEKFKKLTGEAPPKKEDFSNLLWQQWVNFKYRSIEQAMADYNRAIKAASPQAALIVNTWNAWVYRNGHNARNSIRVIENVDGILEEIGWYDTVDSSFFASPLIYNFMDWHLGGLAQHHNKTAMMWSSPSFMRTSAIGPTEATIRVLAMMTNGSVPAQSVPGSATMAQYMKEVADRDPYFRGSKLYPWCGLVVSEKTELWYGKDDPKNRYIKGIYGAFQAMLEQHLPVSLVTDRDLETGQLEPHNPLKVIFAPNCAALSDAEAQTLLGYVKNGGGLVMTYETGWYDQHGRPRERFAFNDILPLTRAGEFDHRKPRFGWPPNITRECNLYLPPDHPWRSEMARSSSTRQSLQPIGNASSFMMACRNLLVQPVQSTAKPPAGVKSRLRTAIYTKGTPKPEAADYPGLFEVAYGKGKIIYLPSDLTWAFYRYGQSHVVKVIELALRSAASEPPPAEVVAPTIVQAMTHEQEKGHMQGEVGTQETQKKRLIVHLLNDISSTGRSQTIVNESGYERREIIPIAGIEVTFRDKSLKQFTLVPGNTPLTPVAVEGGLKVIVPRLEIHAMVVAE